jgi:hypothetical protein
VPEMPFYATTDSVRVVGWWGRLGMLERMGLAGLAGLTGGWG